ncbi:hypothetical protein RFI_35758, partial [Reticulomyxa filosa]
QCKRINGLSLILFYVSSSIIKWPTDTILKIGWLKIDNQRDIEYWDNLLSSPIRHCDVQICAVRPRMAIYDLTSSGSIFPLTESFLFAKETIAEKRGIQYRDAEKFLQKQKGIVFETDFEDNDSDNGKDIQRPTLFFQNIVEAMGIDNAKMEEYRKWFDIEMNKKIACETTLLKKLIFEKRIIKYCFLIFFKVISNILLYALNMNLSLSKYYFCSFQRIMLYPFFLKNYLKKLATLTTNRTITQKPPKRQTEQNQHLITSTFFQDLKELPIPFADSQCMLHKHELIICGGYEQRACYSYHALKNEYKFICEYLSDVQLIGHCVVKPVDNNNKNNKDRSQITLLSFDGSKYTKRHTLVMKYVSVWSNISNKSNELNNYNEWIPFTDNHKRQLSLEEIMIIILECV